MAAAASPASRLIYHESGPKLTPSPRWAERGGRAQVWCFGGMPRTRRAPCCGLRGVGAWGCCPLSPQDGFLGLGVGMYSPRHLPGPSSDPEHCPKLPSVPNMRMQWPTGVQGGWKGLALGCHKLKKRQKKEEMGCALLSPASRGGGDASSPLSISLSLQGLVQG